MMTEFSSPQFGGRPQLGDLNRSPFIVFYEVTQACGLVCRHCRACAQTEAHPAELDTADACRLMDQLAQFPHPPMLVLTGGDPFCRADIFELIEDAKRVGLDVSITPSATSLVTRTAMIRMRDAGIHRMAISIDGATAAAHDAVRGVAGSFKRSIEILRTARSLGIETQVNTTMTPENAPYIDDMANLLSGLGIRLWSVFFLVPVGRAEAAERLSAEAIEGAFSKLWRQSCRQSFAIKTTEAPHYRRYVIQHQPSRNHSSTSGAARAARPFIPVGINDGKGVMFVSHTGTIHPSGFMPIVCGVFPLQNVVQVYQDSQIFRNLRRPNRLEGKCGACEYRHVCGGSRARAYAVTGNPYAEEPDCIYEPAAASI